MRSRLHAYRLTLSITIVAALLAWIEGAGAQVPEGSVAREVIVIRADQAWETPDDTEVLHFRGNFELHAPEWSLQADEADMYGPMDDPDQIVARGKPAVVTIRDEGETVVGEGMTVEYERLTDTLTLRRQAHLLGENLEMSSAEIVFDVGTKRLKSSGSSGVEMILQREVRQ
ncbi:MAG: hypothetical protein KDI31_07095 [Pseudomonadales bacterium]|nr:hypothetical protein [Pseudomonadales bacterium]